MDLGLRGKVAIVTASSRGIGKGVARVMLQEGARVMLFARSIDELKNTALELSRETGGDVAYVQGDLTNRDDVMRLIEETRRVMGPIDVLVYNTGPPKPGLFSELTFDDWDYAVKLLLLSAVWLTKGVVNDMVKRGWGRLIYVTSLTLRQPISNLVLSNTVRLSLAGLVKSLANEYGPKGITANGVMQGYVMTDRVRKLAEDEAKRSGVSIEEVLRSMAKDIPVGRYGNPEEIGYLVAFLASDKASYINGSMILIDGGFVKCVP
ncbi:SDR family oxidoreductase [Caldivirga maquilingensis]|uniref:Short-chain dehydrogenase/reductase SDR n=1 Tax=Caldivirga maquilingensis (strain ATCC 700844 / DSM 13496 / JCM 10307 / IC-167) TaxID=397948 RepID=A8MD18_CALMQ|nr:SDR family oxidoreductase [Caldivirga maquilingensis]ABW01674.1 short-chain dehydrogenase/reductase SDR [Caldivirga maquilingensis IC-167]